MLSPHIANGIIRGGVKGRLPPDESRSADDVKNLLTFSLISRSSSGSGGQGVTRPIPKQSP